MRIKSTLLLMFVAGAMTCHAQRHPLNYNPNKFLGNITTMGQVRSDFDLYWDQLTPENETKWESSERSQGVFDFSTARREYNYCKEHGFKFKFHALLWGAQIPSYLQQLNAEETLKAITRWFDAVANEFPDLEYIDVANEAVKGNNGQGNHHSPYQMTRIVEALGGSGKTGYDWLAQAFIMARERWPNAVLIYNDYNTFQWDTDEYIKVINAIKAAGGPIDAAGCQSHDLNDMSGADFKKALEKVHDGVQLPIFISEYDINKADDKIQETRYKEQFPIMWEADYVAGVTLWGYIFGQTWVDDGNVKGASGLIRDGQERPALKWLREYMMTDAAINAKSPLIDVASDYAFISPSANVVLIGDEATIKAKASSSEDIAEVRVYKGFDGDTVLFAKADTSAINLTWTPIEKGDFTFKLQVLSSVSSTLFERNCTIKACEPAKPFHGTPIVLPGKLEAEDFDIGENSIAYSDSDPDNNHGFSENNTFYRDEVGIDIDKNGNGFVVGWTNSGEWMDYTVDVTEEQLMIWTATVSSGTTRSGFQMYLDGNDLTGTIEVPQTGNNNWNTYVDIKGRTKFALPAGTHKLRIAITGSSCNIDCITFTPSIGNENLTTPYSGKPISLPGVIQAENFDVGMEGEAYHDSEPANQGDKYRSTGVDIVEGNKGYALGYTAAKEWVVYTVTVAESQKLYWRATVSSGSSNGGSFKIVINDTGADVTGEIVVSKTANWDTYTTVAGEVAADLPAGTYKLRLEMVKANCNVDKIEFGTEPYATTAIVNEQADSGVFDVFTVTGVYRGTVEIQNNNTSVLNGQFEKGIYILRNKATGAAKRVMVY